MKINFKICKFLMLMTLACSQVAFCETTEDSKPSKIAKVSRQRKRTQKDDESIASKALKISGGIVVLLAGTYCVYRYKDSIGSLFTTQDGQSGAKIEIDNKIIALHSSLSALASTESVECAKKYGNGKIVFGLKHEKTCRIIELSINENVAEGEDVVNQKKVFSEFVENLFGTNDFILLDDSKKVIIQNFFDALPNTKTIFDANYEQYRFGYGSGGGLCLLPNTMKSYFNFS